MTETEIEATLLDALQGDRAWLGKASANTPANRERKDWLIPCGVAR